MDRDCLKEDNATAKGCRELVVAFVVGLLICFLISLCSCNAQREIQIERVEVPVVVTEDHTVESVKIDHVHDTLIQRDSIYHFVQGDTVLIERWHYTQGVTNIFKTDTIHIYDSIPYPVETVSEKVVTEIKEVPRHFSWWQKTLMGAGGLALISLLLLIAYKFRKR